MADFTGSRPGQVNAAGAADALFLKVYAGEVLTAFERKNKLIPRVTVRTIQSGKSAQFPCMGRVTASYHTAGTQLTGKQIKGAEKVITIDGLLLSDVFITDIDQAMSHFDFRAPYSTEQGRKLATEMDTNILCESILNARAAATVTGLPGGTTIADDKFVINGGASSATTQDKAKALAAGLFSAAQVLDEKDAPEEGRYVVLRPSEVYCLAQNESLINQYLGGQGSISDGSIQKVAGITVVSSNNLPKTDLSGATFHAVDARKVVGVVQVPEAVGVVKLMDLSMQSDYLIEFQGTLMVARYAVGIGGLRPECSVELATSAVLVP